jgi:uncharacterized protein (TIGR01244 family)
MKIIDVPCPNPWRNLLSAGQPAQKQLKAAREAGYAAVIDLRCEGEFTDFDEPAVVKALGMDYLRIPVDGAAGVTESNARALQAAIANADGRPVLCHCGTGNRVGALVALGEWLDGADPETAIAEGKQAGMVALEPHLRGLMS